MFFDTAEVTEFLRRQLQVRQFALLGKRLPEGRPWSWCVTRGVTAITSIVIEKVVARLPVMQATPNVHDEGARRDSQPHLQGFSHHVV